ncbi:MAG: flagellar hook capping FlgD N-terminal domain-containing protein [Planctomycetota bacterium]
MTVSPVTSTGGQTSTVSSTTSTGLNAATFMKIFTAQIANQDPTNPMNSSDFLNQFAQITSVQTMAELQQTLGGVGTNMQSLLASGQMTQAQNLLGHTVGYTDANGAEQQGAVTQISVDSSGNVAVTVAGTQVNMSAINTVQ